jgi:hypothetical protein
MLTILLTDDDGYYPIGVYPAHTGARVRQPLPVVVTDATGRYSGNFVAAPTAARQVTNIPGAYTDGTSQAMGPLVGVQTDNKGYSLWSGKFVGAPKAVVLV